MTSQPKGQARQRTSEEPQRQPDATRSTSPSIPNAVGRFVGRRGKAQTAGLVLGVLAVGAALLLVQPAFMNGNTWASILVPAVVVVVGLLGVGSLSASLAGFDPEAERLADQLTTDPFSQRLMQRWLQRVRWRRWVAGFLGLVVGLFLASSRNEDLGSAAFAYPAIAAVCLASMSAEMHLMRSRKDAARTADLSVRDLGDYTRRSDQFALGLAALAAFGSTAWALMGAAERSGVAVILSLVALTVVVAAWMMQRAVVRRGRPAVSPELRAADDLLRSLAVSRGVARPAIVLALVTLGVAFSAAGESSLEAVAWVLGLGFWWFNRGLGLQRVVKDRSAVPA